MICLCVCVCVRGVGLISVWVFILFGTYSVSWIFWCIFSSNLKKNCPLFKKYSFCLLFFSFISGTMIFHMLDHFFRLYSLLFIYMCIIIIIWWFNIFKYCIFVMNFHLKVKVKLLSHVQHFATPWTVAYQAPQSMEFSRQEYWSGLPFPSPGDLPNPGIEPGSPTLQADTLPSEPPGKRHLVFFYFSTFFIMFKASLVAQW